MEYLKLKIMSPQKKISSTLRKRKKMTKRGVRLLQTIDQLFSSVNRVDKGHHYDAPSLRAKLTKNSFLKTYDK